MKNKVAQTTSAPARETNRVSGMGERARDSASFEHFLSAFRRLRTRERELVPERRRGLHLCVDDTTTVMHTARLLRYAKGRASRECERMKMRCTSSVSWAVQHGHLQGHERAEDIV